VTAPTAKTAPPRRIRGAQARIFRILNPFMRLMLRLPIRRLQERLLLLTYTGRTSGRRYTLPLSYAVDVDGSLLIPGGGAWKWNLDGRSVEVRLHGHPTRARAELIRDADEIAALLPTVVESNPRAQAFIGVPIGADGQPDPERLAQVLQEGFLLVRLRLA
jgi:hypothetical protein